MNAIPALPGTYALCLSLISPQVIQVGRLGAFDFPAGSYLYLGSARGPGGLRARLGRHLHGGGRLHWHIDYLRAVAQVRGYYYHTHENEQPSTSLECCWSQRLAALPGAYIPAPGFGASDCRAGCRAHLVGLADDE